MVLMQPWVAILAAAATITVLLVLVRRGQPPTPSGVRIRASAELRRLPRYRRLAVRRARLILIELIGLAVAASGALLLIARPVAADSGGIGAGTRDIVLCLDVSGSMTDIDRDVVDTYLELAGRLDGDRIALVYFDSSAVPVFPLTDDARFVDEQLRKARAQLDGRVFPGTGIGQGSSLIGDGLANCVRRFDVPELDRSRTVILATDNQVAGRPILSLSQAVDRARERDVMVFGIVPDDNIASATRELREQARRTGGDVLALGAAQGPAEIEGAVRKQEAKRLDRPGEPTAREATGVGSGLILAGLTISIIATLRGRRLTPLGWVRRSGAAALGVVVAVAPGWVSVDADPPTRTDIVLMIDRTTSMGAEDWGDGQPRMSGVVSDVTTLLSQAAPARYSVVTIDNDPVLAVGWTSDAAAVRSLVETMGWRDEAHGSGSDIAAGTELVDEALRESAASHPGARRMLVYFGDGEQTSQSTPGTLSPLRPLLNDALVLGYGTAEGAPMRTAPEASTFVTRDGVKQLSRMDGSNLSTLADGVGGRYVHRSTASPLPVGDLGSSVLPTVSTEVSLMSGLWLVAVAALVLISWELAMAGRGFRLARAEVR